MVYRSKEPSVALRDFGKKLSIDNFTDEVAYDVCLSYERAKDENPSLDISYSLKNHESILKLIGSSNLKTLDEVSSLDYAGIVDDFSDHLINTSMDSFEKTYLFKLFVRRNLLAFQIVQARDTDVSTCRDLAGQIQDIEKEMHDVYHESGLYLGYNPFKSRVV